MRTYKSLLFSGCLLLCFTSAHAADNVLSKADIASAAKLRDRALADPTGYQLVESLTTEVGPRPAGSSADKAAVVWARRQMERIGFANVRTMDVLVPHWVRGEAECAVLAPWPQTMPTLALGGSIGTAPEGIEAETVMVKDIAALKDLPNGAVKDKIVYFSNRMDRTQDGSGYGRAVPQRTLGPAEAAKLGARAVVIRSISTSTDRFPHTGATRYQPDVPRIPGFAISNPDADALERQFASGQPVRMRLRGTSRELPPEHSADVIGEVPGTDRANEIVILGAHLDSWDPGVGAIDDGAGVAIVMNAVKLIRELETRPRRTIRVVLFANEEFGTSGSQAYAAASLSGTERHVLGLEADFGTGPVWRLSSRVDPAQLPLVGLIQREMAPLKVSSGGNETAGGADLDGLAKAGMAMLSPDLDGTLYFDVHHTANDTMDKVNASALRQAVAAYAVGAWLGAQYLGDWQAVTTPKPPRR